MTTVAPPTSAASRSFRDPGGAVFRSGDRIFRAVNASGLADLQPFLETRTAREAIEGGELVRSVPAAEEFPELDAALVLEHERIPFPSYPYEWPPEMLHAAAALTLKLARRALDDGFGLKDATPYNVLFRGPEPVFVDVLSFERRDPRDASWMPYGQFVRTFLLPLLAAKYFGLRLDSIFCAQRDGLDPETVYRWAGSLRRLTPPFLGLVSLPKWMGGRETSATYHPKPARSAEQARFVLGALLKSCERHLKAAAPKPFESAWTGYLDRKSLYSPEQLARKQSFVEEALETARPRTVLDIGANEGHFTFLAANRGASVVAIDSDPEVVAAIWRRARAERADVLPLVVDVTRPSPALGWRNGECQSFLDRAHGSFDLVLMLAVIHHMLVTERVPLEEILDLAAELTRDYVLIEFVAPEDPMFQRIVRGRERLYSDLTQARFEAAAAERFELVRTARIDGLQRWLYLFRPRRATS